MATPIFYSQTSNVANEKYQVLYDIVHLLSESCNNLLKQTEKLLTF